MQIDDQIRDAESKLQEMYAERFAIETLTQKMKQAHVDVHILETIRGHEVHLQKDHVFSRCSSPSLASALLGAWTALLGVRHAV